jgi:hypothetical protein
MAFWRLSSKLKKEKRENIMIKEISKEKKEFIMDLQEFGEQWIDKVNQVMLEHIDELFEDEAIRFLVKQNAESKREAKKSNKTYLLDAYQYGHQVIKSTSFHNHTEALYQLCYKRYVKDDDK